MNFVYFWTQFFATLRYGKLISTLFSSSRPRRVTSHAHALTVLADETVLPMWTEACRLVPTPPVGALHAHTIALKRRAPTALGMTRRPVGPRDVT